MKSYFALASLFATAWASCGHRTRLARRDGEDSHPSFGYTGLEGPLNWHALGEDNSACALGKEQSPIDIIPSTVAMIPGESIKIDIPGHSDGGELENLGTTLEVPMNGSMTLNSKDYALAQFHFHTPSEHRINGEHYPMEVHFVFQAEDESLAVVGFPIEVAGRDEEPLELLENVFENVGNACKAETGGPTGSLDFQALIQHLQTSQVYQYSGSLTTPPCAEQVAWNVVSNPILIDPSTYRNVKKIMKFNSRYTQNHPGEINLLKNARNTINP